MIFLLRAFVDYLWKTNKSNREMLNIITQVAYVTMLPKMGRKNNLKENKRTEEREKSTQK